MILDKELLTKLYWEKSLSLPKIAKRFGTYTSKIWQLMKLTTKMRAFSDWYIYLSEIERLEVASKYPADFIRGFADAEGSSRVKIKGNSKLIEITFSNTNIRYLATMRKLLAELDIQSSKIWTTHYRGHPYYAFAICSKKNVEKYYEKVGFSIQRKVLKVEE
jgi:intein/homing endonuclease